MPMDPSVRYTRFGCDAPSVKPEMTEKDIVAELRPPLAAFKRGRRPRLHPPETTP
jgi:hypothetical protein